MPTDEEVVQTAAEAAEGVIFAHYKQSELTDFDVTVTFEESVLDVDVYVNAPDDAEQDADAVAKSPDSDQQACNRDPGPDRQRRTHRDRMGSTLPDDRLVFADVKPVGRRAEGHRCWVCHSRL